MELSPLEIKVSDRFRKSIGDLESLKNSIQKIGLLHPIVITEDHQLISGYRRLQACKELNRLVEVKIVNITDWLQAEHDENEERKAFTVSERVAIKKAIVERIGKRQGQRTDQLRPQGDEVRPGERTEAYASRKAGFTSSETARRAEKIVVNGSRELVEAVDRNEISIRPAFELSQLPKAQQAEALAKAPKKNKNRSGTRRKRASAKGKNAKGGTYAERQMRSLELTTGKKIGISKEEFDPDFKGSPLEFADQHGYVQIMTRAELEIANDQAAFSAWVGAIRSLRAPLQEYLSGNKFKPENFHAWIKKAKSSEKRMAEIKELASLIVLTRESIDWLLPLLEAKQTNGDHL